MARFETNRTFRWPLDCEAPACGTTLASERGSTEAESQVIAKSRGLLSFMLVKLTLIGIQCFVLIYFLASYLGN